MAIKQITDSAISSVTYPYHIDAGFNTTGEFIQTSNLDDFERSFLQLVGDSYKANNYLYGIWANPSYGQSLHAANLDETPLTVNDVWSRVENTQYEDFFPELAYTETVGDFTAMISYIDERNKAKRNLDEAGWLTSFVAGVPAALTDPLILAPGGSIYRAGKAGWGALKSAASTGGAAIASTAATESFLKYQQSDKTWDEVFVNSMAAGLVGGVIGGGASLVSKELLQDAAQEAKMLFKGRETQLMAEQGGGIVLGPQGTVKTGPIQNAMEVNEIETVVRTAEENRIDSKVVETAAKYSFGITTQMLTSPFTTMAELGNKLFSHTFYLKMNKADSAFKQVPGTSTEDKIHFMQQEGQKRINEIYNIYYMDYLGIDAGMTSPFKRAKARFKGPQEGKMTKNDFFAAVSDVVNDKSVHDEPAVNRAAKLAEEVFDYYREEAVKRGKLPEGMTVKTAPGYLTRYYDVDLITANPTEFNQVVSQYLKKSSDLVKALKDPTTTAEKLSVMGYDMSGFVPDDSWAKLSNIESESQSNLELLIKQFKEADNITISELKKLDTLFKNSVVGAGIKELNDPIASVYDAVDLITRRADSFDQKLQNIIDSNFAEVINNFVSASRDVLSKLEIKAEEVKKKGKSKTGLTKAELSAKKGIESISKLSDKFESMYGMASKIKKEKDSANKSNSDLKTFIQRYEEGAGLYLRNVDGQLFRELEGEEIPAVVEQIRENIISESDAKLKTTLYVKGLGDNTNPLEARVFMIPDKDIKPFMDRNIVSILSKHNRTMSTVLNMHDLYSGYVNPANPEESIGPGLLVNRLVDEFKMRTADLERRITDPNTPKAEIKALETERNQLSKDFKKAKQTLLDALEVMTGVYGAPSARAMNAARAARFAQNWNVISKMGSVLIGSAQEIVNYSLTNGWTAFFKDVFIPIAKDMVKAPLGKPKSQHLEDLMDLGFGNDSALSEMMADVNGLDMHDRFRRNKAEKLLDQGTSLMSMLNTMNSYTSYMRKAIGRASASSIIRKVIKITDYNAGRTTVKPSKWDLDHLRTLRLGDDDIQRIYDQYMRHGNSKTFKEDGGYYANWRRWDDPITAYKLKAAVLNEVKNVMLQPGKGDKSFLAHTWYGKSLFQFKNFLFAAQNRLLLGGALQRANDLNYIGSLAGVIGGNIIAYYIRTAIAGREPSENPARVVAEAISYSGVGAWAMDMVSIADKLMGISTDGFSRYYSRGVGGAFGGPTLGLTTDLFMLAGKLINSARGTEKLTERDATQMARFLPYSNLWYSRKLTDQLFIKALGAEEQ
jgi:hypothetical protein